MKKKASYRYVYQFSGQGLFGEWFDYEFDSLSKAKDAHGMESYAATAIVKVRVPK